MRLKLNNLLCMSLTHVDNNIDNNIYNNINNNNNNICNIKNNNVPACKNCAHFICSTSILYNGKCSLFGEKNIITDEIEYNFAESCRNDDNKCGYEGKYFTEMTVQQKTLSNLLNSFRDTNTILLYIFLLFISIEGFLIYVDYKM